MQIIAEIANRKGWKRMDANLSVATVVRIAELVNVQNGAVVSRQIVKKESGSVTLFAFDRDQGLTEHTSPFDALVQVMEGEAEITVSGHAHRVKSGEMILMPAHEPHALKAIEPFKMMLVMIRTS